MLPSGRARSALLFGSAGPMLGCTCRPATAGRSRTRRAEPRGSFSQAGLASTVRPRGGSNGPPRSRCRTRSAADGPWSQVTCRRQVPFRIRRVYYVHSVAAGAERGGHAHRKLEELLVAVTGSFDLVLHDGRRSSTIHLDRPGVGVYIPRYSWRELKNFSPGAVCLVLASLPYEESDYVRDFEEFARETVDSRPAGTNRVRGL